jgi:hypothetical protein
LGIKSMQQYFFDVIEHTGSRYDYHGRYLPAPENAYRLAELIALDFMVSVQDAELTECTVKVRNVAGEDLFSVQVNQLAVQ